LFRIIELLRKVWARLYQGFVQRAYSSMKLWPVIRLVVKTLCRYRSWHGYAATLGWFAGYELMF
jgi:hypothetical protein